MSFEEELDFDKFIRVRHIDYKRNKQSTQLISARTSPFTMTARDLYRMDSLSSKSKVNLLFASFNHTEKKYDASEIKNSHHISTYYVLILSKFTASKICQNL